MAEQNDGGPAFPHTVQMEGYDRVWVAGMSLRDWFAGNVASSLSVGCSGMLGSEFSAYAKGDCNAVIAERAYALADAMLRARTPD